MNERCRHHTLTTAFCKRPAGHEGCCVFTDSERTYTYAEMLANQAAALRAAADILQFHFNQSTIDTGRIPLALAKKAILALTTDQSALDRHDAELQAQIDAKAYERGKRDTARIYIGKRKKVNRDQ